MTLATPDTRITERIVEFALDADLGGDAPELLELATRAFVDTVGVTIAARHEPSVGALRRALEGERRGGRSTVLATGERTSEAYATLVNGTASHALDYDDVVDALYGHPSAAMFPALLAVAESEGASGRELLEAYAIGFQVVCAVAAGLPIRKHYAHGWHSTATVGVLGATVGLARLLGLDATQARHALGLAASMASGSRQNFGTMTKPLHPGLAGRSAITAARLAQNGFTADAAQLEGRIGYFAMFGVDSDLGAVVRALDAGWALREEGVNVKKYACCYNTHRAADATLAVAPQVDVARIDGAIELTIEPGGLDPLIHHRPTTGLEGKFSGEYVVAAGLLDGRITLDTFTDEAVGRPEAQELLRRVVVVESHEPPVGERSWDFSYATLQLLTGGRRIEHRVDVPKGDARAPLDDGEIAAKFWDCIGFSRSGWDADALLTELRGLPEVAELSGFAELPAIGGLDES